MPNNERDRLAPLPKDPAELRASLRIAAWGGAGAASLLLGAIALVAPAMRQSDIGVTGSTGAIGADAGRESKRGYALAFGESRTLEAARSRWNGLLAQFDELGALTPLVIPRQAANGPAFMLLAGPLPDAQAAADACRRLRGNGVGCEATLFVGEALVSN